MNFNEYKYLDLPKISEEILSYWKKNEIFKKSVNKTSGKNPYIFFEGPPSANGLPGIHHVLARSIKDIFLRFKTMKGFYVQYAFQLVYRIKQFMCREKQDGTLMVYPLNLELKIV